MSQYSNKIQPSNPSISMVPAPPGISAYPSLSHSVPGYQIPYAYLPPQPGMIPLSNINSSSAPIVPVVPGEPIGGFPIHNVDQEKTETHQEEIEDETIPSGKPSKLVEIQSNNMYNVNPILASNILESEYFKMKLNNFKTVNEIVDEIYEEVKNIEPWCIGRNRRIPSTAFCILYKLFTMKMTIKHMNLLLNHKDSHYIRGIGFLYLRFVSPPKKLWDWFEKYLDDTEEFAPSINKERKQTIGSFLEDILTDQNYYGTYFPKIPIPIERDIKKKLLERLKHKTKIKKNEMFRSQLKVGTKCNAEYYDEKEKTREYYPCVITKVLKNGNFQVEFSDYGNIEEVDIGEIEYRKSRSKYRHSRSPNHHRGRDRERSRDRERRRHHREPSNSSDDNIEEEIKRRDRQKALAVGRNYGRRPVSYKQSCSLNASASRTWERDDHRKPVTSIEIAQTVQKPSKITEHRRTPHRDVSDQQPEKKPMSSEQLAKLRQLQNRYGDASNNIEKEKTKNKL